jgi:hypothetical protein
MRSRIDAAPRQYSFHSALFKPASSISASLSKNCSRFSRLTATARRYRIGSAAPATGATAAPTAKAPSVGVNRRRPSSTTGAHFHQAAGTAWPDHRDEVITTLAASPRDAMLFALLSLEDVPLAWHLAHSLPLDSYDV